jgi:hypothetical protein
MTTEMLEKPADLDALERDAALQVSELSEKLARIGPEVFSDVQVEQEAKDLESALQAAEAELQRVARARAESSRRSEREAREQEQKRVAGLLRKAEGLEARINKSDRRYDAAAAELGSAHAENHALRVEQASLLDQAGALAPGHQWAWIHAYSGALAYALLGADPDAGSGRASALVGSYSSGSWAQPKPLASAADAATSNGGGHGEGEDNPAR